MKPRRFIRNAFEEAVRGHNEQHLNKDYTFLFSFLLWERVLKKSALEAWDKHPECK